MEANLTKNYMEEDISKLAAEDGLSFYLTANADFIQKNHHSQRSKYDKVQLMPANGIGV